MGADFREPVHENHLNAVADNGHFDHVLRLIDPPAVAAIPR